MRPLTHRLTPFLLPQTVFAFALACSSESPSPDPHQGHSGASGAPSGVAGASGGSAGQATAGAPAAGSPVGGSGVGGNLAAGSPGAGGASGGTAGAKSTAGAGGAAAGAAGAQSGAGGTSGGSGGGSNGGSAGASGGSGGSTGSGEFKLTAPWDGDETCTPESKASCPNIPDAHRSTMIMGANQLPPLSWTPGPTGTQSYVLVYHDLSNGFAHWAMWNIPASTTSVAADNLPQGVDQASFGQNGAWYGSGACTNVYELVVYALNAADLTPSGSGMNDQTRVRNQLEADEGDLVLARDAVRGTPMAPCPDNN